VLSAWLDGLRLVRDRLLAVLETGGVTPIPTVGHPFDPYLHIAVSTTSKGNGIPGTIVAQERCGYRSPAGVLRYADVIVYQPEKEQI
jgi:molecular chaperone GrpE